MFRKYLLVFLIGYIFLPQGIYCHNFRRVSRATRINCGKRTASNGGDLFWHVTILDPQNRPWCSGTLISSQWILTAAHCIVEKYQNVRIGDQRLDFPEMTERTIMANKIVKHPKYNEATLENDIALLRLDSSKFFKISHNLNYTCLPKENDLLPKPGTICTVPGYGNTHKTLESADVKISVLDKYLGKNYCDTLYDSVPKNAFCAIAKQRGRVNNCRANSGGPLLCETGRGKPLTVVGIASYGYICDTTGVFTSISPYVKWIRDTVAD